MAFYLVHVEAASGKRNAGDASRWSLTSASVGKDCSVESFKTRSEAEQAASEHTPSENWLIVEAPDAPHAIARAAQMAVGVSDPTSETIDFLASQLAARCIYHGRGST